MYKAIGRYGAYNCYEMDLGQNTEIKYLTEGIVHKLNSIKPQEQIRIYVYDDKRLVGRIVDNRDVFDCNPNIPMIYLSNEEYNKWADDRLKQIRRI